MKKQEVIYFIIFISAFLIIYIYHKKINVLEHIAVSSVTTEKEIKQDIQKEVVEDEIKPPKAEPEIEEEAAEKRKVVEVNLRDEDLLETLPVERKIIKRSEINLPDWLDFYPVGIKVKFLIEINQEGLIENYTLLQSSDLYSVDKAVYEFITNIKFEEYPENTMRIIEVIISYD